MHLSPIFVAVVAVAAVFALGGGAVAQSPRPAQPASASPGAANLYAQGPLDGLSMTMAFNRMNGTTPDFRPYGEQSGAYTNATVFDKQAVLIREIARLEGQFKTFDLDRTYSMQIGVPVQQYDPARQGYEIGFNEGSQIGMSDPVNYHSYNLAFRNAGDVNFLPIGDSTAARNFSQRNGFSTQGDMAGQAAIQIAFRLADAPPTLGRGQDTVRADILAARLVSQTGSVLYDFGNTAAANSSPTRSADGVSNSPMLKAVDTQGFRVGMTSAEAEALGTRGFKVKLGQQGASVLAFFNGLKVATPTWARCGNLEFGFQDYMARAQGGAPPPIFVDCVAVKVEAGSGGTSQTVTAVSSEQHLASDPASLLAALRGKYGPPTYVRNNGSNLVWVGRDPAHPDAPASQIVADVSQQGQDGARETLLSVVVTSYEDPHPKAPPAPTVSAAPKL